jgi:hypothetical protein
MRGMCWCRARAHVSRPRSSSTLVTLALVSASGRAVGAPTSLVARNRVARPTVLHVMRIVFVRIFTGFYVLLQRNSVTTLSCGESKATQENEMTAWLRCRLDSGMFSDEVAVTYPASANNASQKSVFVPRSSVRGEIGSQGEVLVSVVVNDGTHYAVLPNSQCDIVKAEDADLRQQ